MLSVGVDVIWDLIWAGTSKMGHSHGWQLMLAIGWKLGLEYQLKHLDMASARRLASHSVTARSYVCLGSKYRERQEEKM